MHLLIRYAPDVPEDTLRKLSIVFEELRNEGRFLFRLENED